MTIRSLLGVLLLLAFSSHALAQQYYSSWMGDNWNLIKDKPLNELVFAGSHDAGTYDLTAAFFNADHKALAPGAPQEYCYLILGYDLGLCTAYARAQSATIFDQLQAGARFFDLRFTKVREIDGSFTYRIHHSFVGPKKEAIFSDIRKFLAQPGHESEVIILQFSQMVGYENGVAGKNTFTTEEHLEFLQEFDREFIDASGATRSLADFMIADSLQVPNPYDRNAAGFVVPCDPASSACSTVSREGMTPQMIVDAGKQLIVYYPTDWSTPPPQTEVTGRFWPKPGAGSWIGGINRTDCKENGGIWKHTAGIYAWKEMTDSECSNLFYPEPSFWQSEDAIANDWIYRLGGRGTSPRGFVSNIAFGSDKSWQMFLNTLVPNPRVIGWASLEDAAAFSNPRAVPHLILRPRKDTNIIMLDFFQTSGIMEEILKLNEEPARVTVKIISLAVSNDSSDCGPGHIFSEACDFYPVFFTNNNESEAPVEQLSAAHQRGRVIDDKNSVNRVSDIGDNLWTYTTAVRWDDPLGAYIQIWDDDTEDGVGLNEDDLVDFAFLSFPTDLLQQLRANTPDGPIFYKRRFDSGLGAVSVVVDLCIQSWDDDADADPCVGSPQSITLEITRENNLTASEGTELSFSIPPIDIPVTVQYQWDFGDGIKENGGTNMSHTYFDDGTYEIAVKASVDTSAGIIEAAGLYDIAVGNVAPTATFENLSGVIPQNTALTLSFSNQFDPGTQDTATGFDYRFDCGNGTNSGLDWMGSASFECSYPELGEFTAIGSIRDKDGDFTSYEVPIEITDGIAPVVSAPPDVTVVAGAYVGSKIGFATATDNVDSFPTVSRTPSYVAFQAGKTTITWSSTDSAGNTGYATQTVTATESGGGSFGWLEFLALFSLAAAWRRKLH